jgi:hypothetical protein
MDKSSDRGVIITGGIISAMATICAAVIGGAFLVFNTIIDSSDKSGKSNLPPVTTPAQSQPEFTATAKPAWVPGQANPDYPNVIASDTEGDWIPAPGYFWMNPDDAADLHVVNYRGDIENVDVDYDVSENGISGMRIHGKFTVDGLQEIRCHIAAYFYYADGRVLTANDPAYSTTDGQVSVGADFIPDKVSFHEDDFTLFIPYQALNILDGSGKSDLKFVVKLYNWRDKTFLDDQEKYFYYSN